MSALASAKPLLLCKLLCPPIISTMLEMVRRKHRSRHLQGKRKCGKWTLALELPGMSCSSTSPILEHWQFRLFRLRKQLALPSQAAGANSLFYWAQLHSASDRNSPLGASGTTQTSCDVRCRGKRAAAVPLFPLSLDLNPRHIHGE